MLSLQEDMRALVNLGLDCSEPSLRLLAMRAAMVDLIAQRNAMGGSEVCPTTAERLKQNHRPEWQRRTMSPKDLAAKDLAAKSLAPKSLLSKEKPPKEKPGRGRALPHANAVDRRGRPGLWAV